MTDLPAVDLSVMLDVTRVLNVPTFLIDHGLMRFLNRTVYSSGRLLVREVKSDGKSVVH